MIAKMTDICNHCGFDNPPGMRYCGYCGKRLNGTTPPQAQDQAPDTPGTDKLGVTIGGDLLERFHKAGLEAAGQRRNVTVLFSDLHGYTRLAEQLDSEDVYNLIQEYIRILVDQVYKYEGIVDKITGDGIMALFGAPIAHENNAERALRSAIDMQAHAADWSRQVKNRHSVNLQMRVGLHSGSVIVGGIGSNMLMDYTAIGDTVNMANRIEEATLPGTILVSDTVYRQTQEIINYKKIPDIKLEDITEPITAYRVIGIKTSPGDARGIKGLRAPMIGRSVELNQLKLAVSNLVENKQGQFILITGEAGIGKSRLKNELKSLINKEAVSILEGQTLTYRRSVSYWIFLNLLRNFLKVTKDTPESEVSRKLITACYQSLGKRAAELIPYFEHLLSLAPSNPIATDRIQYLNAEQLRQQIFMAVRDLIVAEANRQPLLMILEDLHWADEASLDLINFLMDSIPQAPLIIYGISRPINEGLLGKIVEKADKFLPDNFIHLRLQSLSPNQSKDLLAELLDISNFPDIFRQQILKRATGIPFYLEEILRTLIDQGVFQKENDHWVFVPRVDTSSLGVPETLQELILARFDRLEELSRKVLQLASVIGYSFNFELLNDLLKSYEGKIQDTLISLVKKDFISPHTASENKEYAFKHVLIAEAIYGTLLKRERSIKHGQVAEAIEALHADRLEKHIELLAKHYSFSNNLDRALKYSILAGQKAAGQYVNDQARQHFEQGLTLLDKVEHTLDQALHVNMGLADVLVLTGKYSQARGYYQTALYTLDEDPKGITPQYSTLLRKIGTTYERQGDYDEALDYLDQAINKLSESDEPSPIEHASILNDYGWIQSQKGELDEAEKTLMNSLSQIEDSSQYDIIASIYNRLGGIFFQRENLDQASHNVKKSLSLREEIGDTVAVARSHNNLGLLGWRKGDWDDALDHFTKSLELQATLGDVEGIIQLNSNIGLLLTDKGDLEEASKYLYKSLQGAKQIGHGFLEGLAYHHLSRHYLAEKEWKKSLDFSDLSLNIFENIGATENLIDIYASIGEAWLGLGNYSEAKRSGAKAIKILNNSENEDSHLPERGRILRLLGNVARIEEKLDISEKLIIESADHFTKLQDQLELGRTIIAWALLSQAQSDKTGYRLKLNEAKTIFQELGAKVDINTIEHIEK